MIGPAGTGKTTLVRTALAALTDAGGRCVNVSNPALTRDEFIQMMALGFDLSAEAGESKTTMLAELEVRLHQYHVGGIATALVIDEAQALSDELLEEIRLLVNLETNTDKLLPVVLAGQEELSERLAQPSCVSLKQRIALRCHLLPLTARETAQYIATRLRIAGGVPGDAFTRDAIDVIHQRSGGIPRTISVLCDKLADVRLRCRSAPRRAPAGARSVPGFRLRNTPGAPRAARDCTQTCRGRGGSDEARGIPRARGAGHVGTPRSPRRGRVQTRRDRRKTVRDIWPPGAVVVFALRKRRP